MHTNPCSASYVNNLACMLTLQGPVHATLSITFSSFATETGYDYFSVLDGPSSTSPVLLRDSGSTLPGTLISTSNAITLIFTTDPSVIAPGVAAQVQVKYLPAMPMV